MKSAMASPVRTNRAVIIPGVNQLKPDAIESNAMLAMDNHRYRLLSDLLKATMFDFFFQREQSEVDRR